MLLDYNRFEDARKNSAELVSQPKLLNVGCGAHYHQSWTNLDLVSESFDVIPHDLTCGLPFPNEYFDAVYHSHVLEHLKPEEGIRLLKDCFRVLKPGGIVRIVVPDLERIAELYLEMHDKAWEGERGAKSDYDWMKLELLDQLVREHSGGQMGQFMSDPAIKNSDFVRSRVGDEFRVCRQIMKHDSDPARPVWGKLAAVTQRARQTIARTVVRWLLGHAAEKAFTEGLFRNSGEIHRWMYDRFSLRDICEQIGFENFQIVSARESQINHFENYELDVVQGQVRKPDSLFTECRKPLGTTRIS